MAVNVGDLLELGYEGYVTRNSALLHAESFLNEQLALYPDAADTLQELIEDGGYVARYDHYVELRNADDLPDIQVRTSIDQFEDRSGARDWFDWREDGDDDLETDLEIGRRSELSEVTGANDEATWHALDFTFVDGNVVAGIRVAAFSYDDEEPEADEELLIAAAELLAEKIAAVQDEGGHALGNRIVRFENGTAILHEHDEDVLVVDNDAYTTIDQEYLPIYLDAPEHVEAYNAENEEAGILTEYTYQPGIYVEEFDVWQLVSIWAREWEDADLAGEYVADPENAQYDRVEQEELTDLGEWGDQSHVYTNDIKVDAKPSPATRCSSSTASSPCR